MIVTANRDTARTVRLLDLEDGPILAMKYSTVGRRFRAQRVSISYIQHDGRWRVQHADVSGAVLRKDGSDSLQDATNSYYSDDYPDWLMEIIDAFRPHGGAVKRVEPIEVEVEA